MKKEICVYERLLCIGEFTSKDSILMLCLVGSDGHRASVSLHQEERVFGVVYSGYTQHLSDLDPLLQNLFHSGTVYYESRKREVKTRPTCECL